VGTDAPVVPFPAVTIPTENLKPKILRIIIELQPLIKLYAATYADGPAVGRAIISSVVNGQKSGNRFTATCAFSAVGSNNGTAKRSDKTITGPPQDTKTRIAAYVAD